MSKRRVKKRTKKKQNPLYGFLTVLITLLAGSIVIMLLTDIDRAIVRQFRNEPAANQTVAEPASEPGPETVAGASTDPEPVARITMPEPEPDADPAGESSEPAADVVPIDITPARPRVDDEALRLEEAGRQARALFLLSDNYYKTRKFDLAIDKLQQIIELDHPDWTAPARERIEFIRSVQAAQ